jgi:hypothetical protein
VSGSAKRRCVGCVAAVALAAAAVPAHVEAQGTEVAITSLVPRWSYLDATLDLRPQPLRFLFPDEGACRTLLRPDSRVTYVRRGPLGELRNAAGDRCEPVGIASLRAWRDRSVRPRTATPVPRAQATFRIVHRDGELAFARGRFPLATLVGWTGAEDTIALIPDDESCRAPLEAGVASMEFRFSGRVPYRLVTGRESCPIVGFVRPLPAGS